MPERSAADIRHLSVIVAAQIDGDQFMEQRASAAIPPAYDAADVRALVARQIEDTAFALVRREFGREPTRTALRAAVARLIGIERALDDHDGIVPRELRIRAIIALSNQEAIDTYGEPDED